MAENDHHIAETSQLSQNDVSGELRGEDRDRSAAILALEGQNENPDFAPVPLSDDRTLDIQRLIDVMDHYLTCEAAWHGGYPIEQTVLTCIYVHDSPNTLSSHVLLHSFCDVARSTTNDVAQVRQLDENFFDARNEPAEWDIQILEEVEEKLSRQLKTCEAPLSEKSLFEDVEPLQPNRGREKEFCEAVLCRLRFRKHFYNMLACLREREGKGFELAMNHIESCSSELLSMLKSEELSRPFSTVLQNIKEYTETTASGSRPVGFGNSSPRIELCSWKEAVDCFQKLLQDLKIICSNSMSPFMEHTVRFLVDFHKFPRMEFARAYIQLLVVHDKRLYGREPIFVIICKAARLPKKANNHSIQKVKAVDKLGELLIKLLRALCKDLKAQRLELSSILSDWRQNLPQLSKDLTCEYGDRTKFTHVQNKFHQKMCEGLLAWAREQRHWIALRYLLLGFDLKRYSFIDLCMSYWYIYVLLNKLVEEIELKMVVKNASILQNAKMKRQPANDMDDKNEAPPEVLLLRCYAYVAQGLILVTGLLRTKFENLSSRDGPHDDEQQRFTLNFSALLEGGGYQAEAAYNDFKKHVSESRFSEKFLRTRDEFFEKAHRTIEQLKGKFSSDTGRLAELHLLEAVAKTNETTFNALRAAVGLGLASDIFLDSKTHPHFAAIFCRAILPHD